MTYIARIDIGHPIGQDALQTVPDMVLEAEAFRSLPDGQWRVLYWASGGDFEAYESALADDPTIATYTCLTRFPNRRLYRITLSAAGESHLLHRVALECDIVPKSITMTAERVEFLGRFPSHDSLISLRDACRDREREFELLSLYEARSIENDAPTNSRYGITESQREALLAGFENGYFDVPRETTMEEVADSLGISTSALSTRLRRGQQALLRSTLARDAGV